MNLCLMKCSDFFFILSLRLSRCFSLLFLFHFIFDKIAFFFIMTVYFTIVHALFYINACLFSLSLFLSPAAAHFNHFPHLCLVYKYMCILFVSSMQQHLSSFALLCSALSHHMSNHIPNNTDKMSNSELNSTLNSNKFENIHIIHFNESNYKQLIFFQFHVTVSTCFILFFIYFLLVSRIKMLFDPLFCVESMLTRHRVPSFCHCKESVTTLFMSVCVFILSFLISDLKNILIVCILLWDVTRFDGNAADDEESSG